MKVSCILFTLLFVLFSCQESEKERISRLVKEWDGKEIVFPTAQSSPFKGVIQFPALRETLPIRC